MKLISLLALALLSFNSYSIEIEKVKIWGDDSKPLKVITEPKHIELFRKLWEAKSEVKLDTHPQWTNKIDLIPGDRWLYSDKGYLSVLSMKKSRIYYINNVDQFNVLIKSHNKAQQNDLR